MEVKIFCDYHSFVFRKGKRNIGFALFHDLKLTHEPRLPREDIEEMEWLLGYYQLGEVMTFSHAKGKALGPAREFELEVTLHACGNPDHQQYADVGPKKTIRVCITDEAITATMAYQQTHNMGQGNIAPMHGKVWRMGRWVGERRKHVGWVTFGGRYETIAEREASTQMIKEKYKTKNQNELLRK